MSASVINAVLCNGLKANGRANLRGVGSKWPAPPKNMALWIEFVNLSEAAFTVMVQVRRGRRLIDETHTELVLAGQSYWQTAFEWEGLRGIESKTYSFAVLVNGVTARTMVADFGARES